MSRLLGGLLSGLGRGLEAQEQQRHQDERDRILFERQIALQKLGASDQAARDKTQHEYRVQETREELGIRAAIDARQTELEAKFKSAQEEREFEIWRKKEGIEHGNAMALEAFRAQKEIERDAAKESRDDPITHFDVDDDGHMVGFTKNGRVVVDNSGRTFPKGGKEDNSILGDYGGRQGMEPPKQTPRAVGGKTYTMEEARETARARGIPIEEVHRVMREAGYKLTTG